MKRIFKTGIFVLFAVALLTGCTEQDKALNYSTALEENVDATEAYDLAGKIFQIAQGYDFDEACEMHIECDCCSGNWMFLADGVFYDFSYCIADIDFSEGHYEVKNDQLKLTYLGTGYNKVYNWEAEENPALKPFSYKTFQFSPVSVMYSISTCAGKLKLAPVTDSLYTGLEISDDDGKLRSIVDDFERNTSFMDGFQ